MSRSRKNPRLCRVVTILPSSDREELVSRLQAPLGFVSRRLDTVSDSIKESFSATQKDIVTSTNRLESLIEKVLYLSIISIVISCITLCIC